MYLRACDSVIVIVCAFLVSPLVALVYPQLPFIRCFTSIEIKENDNLFSLF